MESGRVPSTPPTSSSTRHHLEAAVAQLVERNLAKVEVESSRLFCRSISPHYPLICFAKASVALLTAHSPAFDHVQGDAVL